MNLDLHYVEPRLVAMYDIENPRGADYDFYLHLADEIGAQTIVDLGCGTGQLTRELATDGRRVLGVDPASEMLAYARQQPGAERVEWINGTASTIGTPNADLAIMTGNVAQVFLDDAEWNDTLRHIGNSLKRGGTLAFESRNPATKAWEGWNPDTTRDVIKLPDDSVETWLEVVAVGEGTVSFRGYNRFASDGALMVVDSTLRFRTMQEITQSLSDNGFHVDHVYGSWTHKSFEPTDAMMLFIATRL